MLLVILYLTVAFYVFERFHILNETVPDFSNSQSWYLYKVHRGTSPTSALSAEAHREFVKKAHITCNVRSKSITHLGRKAAKLALEANNVDSLQQATAGRWSLSAMQGAYGSGLAIESMLALAGYPPKERVFFLKRAEGIE